MDAAKCCDPPLIEYARYHGLAVDHRAYDLLAELPPVTDFEATQDDFEGLLSFFLPATKDILAEPRFQLNSRERVLLANSIKAPAAPDWKNLLPDHHRIDNLKLEMPLLLADHAADMRSLSGRTTLVHEDLTVPLEAIDEENDEGLSWPSKYLSLAADWHAKIAREKLSTTKEAMLHLRESIQDGYTPELHEAVLKQALRYEKHVPVGPVSPLVTSFDNLPATFDLSTLYAAPLSDRPHLDLPERQECDQESAEEHKMKTQNGDLLTRNGVKEALLHTDYGPFPAFVSHMAKTLDTTNRTCLNEGSRRIKQSNPPSPPTTSEEFQPTNKRMPFARTVDEYIPRSVGTETSEIENNYFDRNLSSFSPVVPENVEDTIKNEQQKVASIDVGMHVPNIPPLEIAHPLHRTCTTPQEGLGSNIREDLLYDHFRVANGKMASQPERTLIATSIDELDACDTREHSGHLQSLVEQPRGIIEISQMPIKLRGLRKLDGYGGNQKKPSKSEVAGMVPKVAMHVSRRRSPMNAITDTVDVGSSFDTSLHDVGARFSAVGSLSSFIATRINGVKRAKLTSNHHFPNTTQEEHGLSNEGLCQSSEVQFPATPSNTSILVQRSTLWRADAFDADPARVIVINSILLQNQRELLKHLTYQFGLNLTMIYRDLEGHEERDGLDPQRSVSTPNIILSPNTALIYTSLYSTTQRPLPGQGKARAPVQDRMADLATVYDSIIVLLTHSFGIGSPNNDTHATIAAFTDFAATLAPMATVEVVIVHSQVKSPNKDLFDMITAAISEHGFQVTMDLDQACFNQEETHGELFLRKVGLNPLAAQVVLGLVHKSGEQRTTDASETVVGYVESTTQADMKRKERGLREFGGIPYGQMMSVFGDMIGQKAVDRVHDFLGMIWEHGMDATLASAIR